MRVAVCASGTAGHINPALSIIEGIKEEVLFFCKKGTVIGRSLKNTVFLDVERRPGSICKSIMLCDRMMRKFGAEKVVAMGGYACIPPLVVALWRKIPFILHEQNTFPGRTNRLFAPFAESIAVSFSCTLKYFPRRKSHLVGNPVDKRICTIKKEEAQKILGLEEGKRTVLVFGGSLGAASINAALIKMMDALLHLKDTLQFIHITGVRHYHWVMKGLKSTKMKILLLPYTTQMHIMYAAADIVVCRAGATSLFEIAKCRKASIIVPYPHATDDHQRRNAYFLKERGAAEVIEDEELHGLPLLLQELLRDEERLALMQEKVGQIFIEDATERMLSLINGG